MEYFQIKPEYAENQVISGGVSVILQSGLFLKNIRIMFFVKRHVHYPGDADWQQKHSLKVLKNETIAE